MQKLWASARRIAAKEGWAEAARRGIIAAMTAPVDPALIGIWIVPGQPFTYEVDAEGGYHIAGPEEPLSFAEDGATMIWGPRRYRREDGAGQTPVGQWREDESGDTWRFEADGAYRLEAPDGAVDTGIWGLRDAGAALWVREQRAHLATDGAHLTLVTADGGQSRYGYTVRAGIWILLDPVNWAELSRFFTPEEIARRAAQ